MSTETPPSTIQFLVPLRDAERELNRHMKALQGTGQAPMQRARMSNLVIFCSSLEQSIDINEQIPHISAVHPARTLLVVGESGPRELDVTARVTVRPIGGELGKRYACSEQVTLHAAGSAVDRLPFAVRSLLIGDLPINLWWATPQPPPLAGALLYELAENAQQIIYDSLGWRDPTRGVAATASWLEQMERADPSLPGAGGRWRVASDLNWRRLKYWRRILAQALDPASAPGAAESVTEVLVEHGPHAVVQAWELASWLAGRLEWRVQAGKVHPGVEIAWRFLARGDETRVRIHRLETGPPAVHRVRIACTLEGQRGALTLMPEGSQRLALMLEGVEAAPRTMNTPPQTAADLIGRQLSDRERDPVFRQSMATAQVMAQNLLS
jgi:glucose-6-phosphate dehydrogenase assembly protein OpcA